MFVEILFLVIIFVIATATGSIFFYIVLIIAFFLCLPGIIALNSAPYVPTLKKNADTMIELANIKPGMKVYDLGAGDGKLVEKAANQGASAIGYEISFALFLFFWLKKAIFFLLSRHSRESGNPGASYQSKRKNISKDRVLKGSSRVVWGSFWTKDIYDADVVLCFLMPRAMKRFEKKKFGTMKKGSRLVSNIFPLPNIKADKTENNVHLYIKK
jgi:hypothetical protein